MGINDLSRVVTLERFNVTKDDIISNLYIGTNRLCYAIEDTNRLHKIKHHTCIGGTNLRSKVTYSPKFKRNLPIIYNRPDLSLVDYSGDVFSGIRIHVGSTKENTSGCILLGSNCNIGVRNSIYGNGRELVDVTTRFIKNIGEVDFRITYYVDESDSTNYVVRNSGFKYNRNISVLQSKLVDLGNDIVCDGLLGNSTFIAYNKVTGLTRVTIDGIKKVINIKI